MNHGSLEADKRRLKTLLKKRSGQPLPDGHGSVCGCKRLVSTSDPRIAILEKETRYAESNVPVRVDVRSVRQKLGLQSSSLITHHPDAVEDALRNAS